MRSRRLQCFARMPDQSCRTEHICSACLCAVSVSRLCVCLWLWSVAGAVGTFMEAVSRCILAVYTSYKLYLTVWTRERPPVRVRCAICKKRTSSTAWMIYILTRA